MTITIRDAELDEALQASSAASGLSVDDFVATAVREKLERSASKAAKPIDWQAVREIQKQVASVPILDTRTPDEIIGYDKNGLFEE